MDRPQALASEPPVCLTRTHCYGLERKRQDESPTGSCAPAFTEETLIKSRRTGPDLTAA
jgi:hypothetical protein